jgi:hypothetical protein
MFALCGICAAIGLDMVSSNEAAQIASSVEYDFISPSAGVAGDVVPGEAASLKFLSIKAIDGNPVAASLCNRTAKN